MANTGNTQQQINYGAAANDGQGDPLRTAFIKTDENFDNVWLAGPVGSNITIFNNTIQVNNTNGNLVLKPNGIGAIQANASVLPNAAGIRDLGSSALRWRNIYADSQILDTMEVSGDLTVGGNLTVEGNTIQIGNIVTDTKTIQLANTAVTAAAANGSGITVGANDNIATILYDSGEDAWVMNISAIIGGNITADGINVGSVRTANGVYGEFGAFRGLNGRGIDAIFAGVDGGTFLGSDVIAEFTGNSNAYTQFNFQNINDGTLASGDYVITADNGDDSTFYINLGLTSSNHADPDFFGDTTSINDGYLYVTATDQAGPGSSDIGNLIIGSTNGNIKMFVGNTAQANVIQTISVDGIEVIGNVVANYFIGDGSGLTNLPPTYTNLIENGDSNVAIAAPNGDITVNANTQSWMFSTEGVLILPNGGEIRNNEDTIEFDSANDINLVADNEIYLLTNFGTHTWYFDSTGNLTAAGDILPSANNVGNLGAIDQQWNSLYVGNNTIYIGGVPLGISAGNVLTVNGEAVLSNDSDSSITTTGNITADYFFGNGSQLSGINVSTDSISDGNSSVSIDGVDGNAVISTNGGDGGIWIFGTNGNLTVPGTIKSAGGLVYREWYATLNQIYDADDPTFSQIVLSQSSSITGANQSTNTNNDDFTVTGLGGSNRTAVINLYSQDDNDPIALSDVRNFVQTYIDLVLYDGDTLRNSVSGIQSAFAVNETALIDSLPPGTLNNSFNFNAIQSIFSLTGFANTGTGTGAAFYFNYDDDPDGTVNYNSFDSTLLVPGSGYAVLDEITVPGAEFNGTSPANDMIITVQEIDGNGGIIGYGVSGSMSQATYEQCFVKYYIDDGDGDAYDLGNYVGTNRSACTFTATSNDDGELVVTAVASGALRPFMSFYEPDDNDHVMILWQKSGVTEGGPGTYICRSLESNLSSATYVANGIQYAINEVIPNSPEWNGGDYGSMVSVTAGIWSMVAVDGDIDSFGYSGETGADGSGEKTVYSQFFLSGADSLTLAAGDETWAFGSNGNLTLPAGGILSEGASPTGLGNTIAIAPSGGSDPDQQLLVYPTVAEGNHLHLTSGNLYNTELYLGNDNLYVKLTNTGNVVISGDDAAGNGAQWTFDTTGNLNLPNGGAIVLEGGDGVIGKDGDDLLISWDDEELVLRSVGGDVQLEADNDVEIRSGYDFGTGDYGSRWIFNNNGELQSIPQDTANSSDYNGGYIQFVGNSSGDGAGYTTLQLIPDETRVGTDQYLIVDPTAPGHIHIRAGGTQDNSFADLFLGGENSYVKVGSGSNPPITVTANTESWTFDTAGNLTFPDATVQTTAWTGILPDPTYSGSDEIGLATPAPLNLNNSAASTLLTQLNLINTGGGPGAGSAIDFWTYTSINDVPQVRLQAVDNGDYSADFAIKIKANGEVGLGSLTTTWTFGADGNLTLPGNTFAVNYANGTAVSLGGNYGNAEVADFLDSLGSNAIVTTGNITGGNLISSATIFGNVDVVVGNIANASATKTRITSFGANSYIQTGNGTVGSTGNIVFAPYSDSTEKVVINTANGDLTAVGNVTADNVLLSGNITGSSANVTITANSFVTTFDTTGLVTFPGNVTVTGNLFATGTDGNVVTKFESTWTAPVGNSTQSFTVDANNTYYMWVVANIPNGIITWNATATITNTNVPVVGVQYAWVYDGAGTPIDFTSIPNQFVGTANTIVRSNVSPGVTTNRFDFGINNTSGSEQTVRYGWIRIS